MVVVVVVEWKERGKGDGFWNRGEGGWEVKMVVVLEWDIADLGGFLLGLLL